jgi:DNA-directed RNA polymerase specialized sigma24 family protein
MQVGRSPNLLGESVGRGWVSSRRVRTFEDALIFVLDVERCLQRLTAIDRQLISRIIPQEYTQAEAAALLRISVRTICSKLPQAIDRLTEILVEADLLVLPD